MSDSVPTHRFDRMLKAAIDFEKDWRTEAQTSFEYYDGTQWSDEDEAIIEARGQQASVLNVIRPTIDLIMSLQAERRLDLQVVGREQSDDLTARLLTELLKQVLDQSDYDYYETQTFRQGIIGGRGAIQIDIEEDESNQKQVYARWVPWEEIYIDPYHRKPDASDARYICRGVWMDRDEVKGQWPDKAELVDSTFNDDYQGQEYEAQKEAPDRGLKGSYYNQRLDRICVYEMWYKDETGKLHQVIFSDAVFFRGTEKGANPTPFEEDGKTTINMYPIIPFYSFRNHLGRPKGLPEYLKDMQDMLNKENSKYLWTISSNRVIMEKDAAEDPDLLREELNRPDGTIILKSGGLEKFKMEDSLRESSFLLNHMQFLIAMIQRTSGVNDSMIGLGGQNERSAMQQQGRINQGAAMQTSIIENLLFTKKQVARVILRFIGSYYTDKRIVRITGANGQNEYFPLNEEVVNPETGTKQPLNKIDDILRYDVLLKPVPAFTTTRQNNMMIFGEVLKTQMLPPEIAGEIIVELSDLPNKQDILYRMQKMFEVQRQAAQAAQLAQQNSLASGGTAGP